MHIFISEFFSGGGLSNQDIPGSLLSEGFAMLSALINDFKRLSSQIKITTTLDHRIKRYVPPLQANNVIEINEMDNYPDYLERIGVRMVDMALIIAPETGKILTNLTKILEEETNTQILSSSSIGVESCTNKFKTYNLIRKLKIKIPKTKLVKFRKNEIPEDIFKFPTPFVLKPLDGVAGAGITLVENINKDDIKNALKKIKEESSEDAFLIQEFVEGLDLSVSLVTNSRETLPLSINFQNINLKSKEAEYQGGYTPYETHLKEELFDISKKIIKRIKGLNGYVGIDFVVSNDEIYFMEVNPRITTSYIGIQEVLNQNIANYLLNLDDLNSFQNDEIKMDGVSFFSKTYKDITSIEKLKNFIKYDTFVHQLIAPPFKVLEEKEKCSAFLAVRGNNLEEAKRNFEKKEKKFQERINF